MTELRDAAAYERERASGLQALEAGHLDEARGHFAAALASARQLGDVQLVDRALCNEAAVAISLGDVERPIPELRAIVMRNLCPENCALAAYNIARAYELRKECKKSLFYARIARDRALQAGSTQRLAAATNQIGNALLADSFFEEAAESYRRALALVPAGLAEWQLICQANLAYCEVMNGQPMPALRHLYRVLRAARRLGSPRLQMIARLDLCFVHMELGRYRTADRYGRRGLALAEVIGEVDWVKNGLYLLGQIAVLEARDQEARRCFGNLQSRFYPDQPYLPEFLLGIDVRKVINLRA